MKRNFVDSHIFHGHSTRMYSDEFMYAGILKVLSINVQIRKQQQQKQPRKKILHINLKNTNHLNTNLKL